MKDLVLDITIMFVVLGLVMTCGAIYVVNDFLGSLMWFSSALFAVFGMVSLEEYGFIN